MLNLLVIKYTKLFNLKFFLPCVYYEGTDTLGKVMLSVEHLNSPGTKNCIVED
jgi:hypothetical protein